MWRIRNSYGRGEILITALVTLGITAVVGITAGLAIFERSDGCDDVWDRYDANKPVTEEELDRCWRAYGEQWAIAGGAASFVPTGADDAIVMAPMSALLDRTTRSAPSGDASLPADVAQALACGNDERDPGEECDATAQNVGCGSQTCVSCSCITIPSFPDCPSTMPSHLGDWVLDPERNHVPNPDYTASTRVADCSYYPPAGAGLGPSAVLRFSVDALHSGMDDIYPSNHPCTEDFMRPDPIAWEDTILDTGDPDWYPITHNAERLISPDRCASVYALYGLDAGITSLDHAAWLRAHPRVLFEAHALAEQLFFQIERTAFQFP